MFVAVRQKSRQIYVARTAETGAQQNHGFEAQYEVRDDTMGYLGASQPYVNLLSAPISRGNGMRVALVAFW